MNKSISTAILITATALYGFSPRAQAQWAVIDVGAIAQLIQEVATLQQQLANAEQQLSQAQQQFQSTTGQRGMQNLLSGTDRNYLPTTWSQLPTRRTGMGFFATFSAWLNGLLATYIGDNTARIAGILSPAILTAATVYVMMWGYLQLTGKIEEPLITGVKRIILLVVILGGALDLWLYNDLIVDTFFRAPGELAAGICGAYDPTGIVDQIIFSGGDAASLLIQKGGVFNGDFSYYLAGFAVYLIVGLTAIYTMFLLALSKIALSILLALGPLFIALLFFETTKRFFEAWIAQLANYAFVTILTVLVAALMMGIVSSAAQQAAARGGGIQIADAVRVCMTAGLTFLIMRQVMAMSAGLASGLALSSFGLVSAALAWGFGGATRNTQQFARGLIDRETARGDSLSRKAGYHLKRGVGVSARRLSQGWRENTIGVGRS